jgi:transaldolase
MKKIKIFADGADIKTFLSLNKSSKIEGFTTNPSLMKKAGINNYKNFAQNLLKKIKKKPISFEIFADKIKEIEFQAREIAKWGKNVFVKIPIINTKNLSNAKLIGKLNNEGFKINVTAIFTLKQTKDLLKYLGKKNIIILSVFCGRIADTGIDPSLEIKKHIMLCKNFKNVKILWASVREPFNIIEAERAGCDIITVSPEFLNKMSLFRKDLTKYSIETVKMFYNDAKKLKYKI